MVAFTSCTCISEPHNVGRWVYHTQLLSNSVLDIEALCKGRSSTLLAQHAMQRSPALIHLMPLDDQKGWYLVVSEIMKLASSVTSVQFMVHSRGIHLPVASQKGAMPPDLGFRV